MHPLSDVKWRIGVGISMISHSVPSSQPVPYQFFRMHACRGGILCMLVGVGRSRRGVFIIEYFV